MERLQEMAQGQNPNGRAGSNDGDYRSALVHINSLVSFVYWVIKANCTKY